MHNNDAYLEYFLSQPRMPAPAVRRERSSRRESMWTRARKARSAR